MSGLDPLVGRHEVPSPEAMEGLGERMGRMLRAGDLVVLTGPLGAGKTTLARGIGRGLGIRGPVQSPTFVLARTHPSLVGGAPLVHVDAYRLGSAAELDDLDLDLDGSVAVVEWGRGMVEGLRETWWEVELDREGSTRPERLEGPEAPVRAPAARGTGGGRRGVDEACGATAREADLDADVPRLVTISRHGR